MLSFVTDQRINGRGNFIRLSIEVCFPLTEVTDYQSPNGRIVQIAIFMGVSNLFGGDKCSKTRYDDCQTYDQGKQFT